jgi:serine/threonine-protein kinase
LLGQLFRGYRIDARLAQGGMGAVYLVRDPALPNIRKVLKIVLPEFAKNAVIRERFLREAEAVSRLKHRNIVGIDASGTLEDGQLCMLIPFLDGKSLDAFLREHGGRLPPHRVMHMVCHVARGLEHAHQLGIVHRDLKPPNVFVEPTEDDRYFCKVLDFGIAKELNTGSGRPSSTLSGPMGTPSYMAVEQYEHAAEVTPAADVYALAIMVWQMVTGHLPWGEHDPAVLYRLQMHEPPRTPVGATLSADWEAILRTSLAPDPRQRPQSMRQFVQALASALPAIEPLFPSGAEILRSVARNLVAQSAHDDETVRNQSDRPLAPMWPVRETPLPIDGRGSQVLASSPSQPPTITPQPGTPQSGTPQPGTPQPGTPQPGTPQPGTPITEVVSANPYSAPATPTTIGASHGIITAHAPAPRPWKLAALGLSAVALAGLGTFALATWRGHAAPAAAELPGPLVPARLTASPPPPDVVSQPVPAASSAPNPAAAAPSPSTSPPPNLAAATAVPSSPPGNVPASTVSPPRVRGSTSTPSTRTPEPLEASKPRAPVPVTAPAPPASGAPLAAVHPQVPSGTDAGASTPQKPKALPTTNDGAAAKPRPAEPARPADAHRFNPDAIGGQENN